MKIIEFDSVVSTNALAREYAALGENTVIVARSQSGGKGTKGRTFSSLEGGIYMSYLKFYDNLPATDGFSVMVSSAVALAKTLETFRLKPKIKWANDLLVGGKKISGILIENVISGGCIKYSIIGIGLNVNNLLPAELDKTATSMARELGEKLPLNAVLADLLKNLDSNFSISEYAERMAFIGERKLFLRGSQPIETVIRGVSNSGLLITDAGEFSAGEISFSV